MSINQELLKITIQHKVLDGIRASQLQGFSIQLIIIIVVNLNYLLKNSWWKIIWTTTVRYIPACLAEGRWHLHKAWLSRQWGEKECCNKTKTRACWLCGAWSMSIPAQSKVKAVGGQSYKNHDQTQIRPWVACSGCSPNIGGGRGPPKHSQILIVKSKTEEPYWNK